jgi:hypothetical protein
MTDVMVGTQTVTEAYQSSERTKKQIGLRVNEGKSRTTIPVAILQ